MARKKKFNTKYSPEFKLSVILDMREHNLGYKETARKYRLVKQSFGGALMTLHRWERIYLEEGASDSPLNGEDEILKWIILTKADRERNRFHLKDNKILLTNCKS